MGKLDNIFTGFKNLFTGKETPDEHDRLTLCKVCPHLRKQTNTCGKCGCYVPAKVKSPKAKCPINKW